jgi:AraC family transcriptional regulator
MNDEGAAEREGLLATRMIENPARSLGIDDEVSRHCSLTLDDGVVLMHWRSVLDRPIDFSVVDDSGFVHFSYVLHGGGTAQLGDRHAPRQVGRVKPIQAGTGNIAFGPGQRWRFQQQGEYESVGVMVRHDIVRRWLGDDAAGLVHGLAGEHCFETCLRGQELHLAAQRMVSQLYLPDGAQRHPLWWQAQGLSLVGLLLEAHDGGGRAPALQQADRHRFARARDDLLSDLAQPPLLADLAARHGLGLAALQRGFRAAYGISVYALFQRERMNEAHRRLSSGTARVTTVAAEMGYTNLSHFSAAFRQQFGINPGQLLRSGALSA